MEKFDQSAWPTNINESEEERKKVQGNVGKAQMWDQAAPAVMRGK